MKYQVVLAFDPETNSYCATVPGLPIIVDADNEEEALKMAREAIAFYFEETGERPGSPRATRPGRAKVVTVEVDASTSR